MRKNGSRGIFSVRVASFWKRNRKAWFLHAHPMVAEVSYAIGNVAKLQMTALTADVGTLTAAVNSFHS